MLFWVGFKHNVRYFLCAHLVIQAQLEEQLEGLQTLVAARRGKLEETKKLHQFMREANEVASWIADQLATASSTDYGKDFEHLQVSCLLYTHLYVCGVLQTLQDSKSL